MAANDNLNELIQQEENYEIEGEPLYIMTVELDKGKSENIKIYPDSKPEELSYDFCKRFNLDFASLVHLTNQIKSLLDNNSNDNSNQKGSEIINSNNNNAVNNNHLNNNKNECIIEVDEEDAQISDPRVISSNNNDISHSLLEEEIEDNNNNSSNNKKLCNSNEEDKYCNNIREIKDPSRQNTDQSLKDNNNTSHPQISEITTNSLFSYEEFYNRFKNKIKSKQKSFSKITNNTINNIKDNHNTSTIKVNNNLNKTITEKKVVSLSENEKHFKDFLEQSKNLDDIYYNHNNYSHNDQFILMNHYPNTNCTQNKTKQDTSGSKKYSIYYSKSHTNSINDHNKLNRPIVPFNKITFKSPSSQSINKENRNFGERLYQSGIQMKEKINRKILELKQTIEQEKEVDNTFHPKTLNRLKHDNTSNINNIKKHNIPFSNRKLINPYMIDRFSNKSNYKANYSYSEKHKDNYQGNPFMQSPIEDRQNNAITQFENRNDIIYNKKKEETFKKIYHILNSKLNEPNQNLPTTIYNIIQPVLYEIQNKKNQNNSDNIKERDFVTECMKYFEIFSFDNKRALLDFNSSIAKKA